MTDNALRAVGSRGRARVDATVRSAMYVVRVGDSGPGVAPALSDRIFEPFFTTRPPGEGTGLRLAIARRVLREAGGSIELGHSELGGAQFTVHVPVRPPRLAVS